jgi:hypothetical protein
MKHKLLSVASITVLVFTVLVNLIGCGTTTPPTKYTLTITSTAGGDVTTPAEGTYTYAANSTVSLVATPDAGYRFVEWTATAGTFGSANLASTTFTMPSQDATVTAHFALGVFIDNVPDTNQPPTATLPTTIPVNYCAPTAMVNILGYWDVVKGHANAHNLTAFQQPPNLRTAAEYLGYFMDTNNTGSPDRGNDADRHSGTYAKDIRPGTLEFVRWDATHNPPTLPPFPLPAGKLGYVWTGTDDYVTDPTPGAFNFYKAEIDAGRPLVVVFRYWSLVPGVNVTDPESGEIICVFGWGPPINHSPEEEPADEQWNMQYGEACIGHAVTGVGYVLNWDPHGPGPLAQGNYIIVHDTWSTTPQNIAVPWTGAPWNSSHKVNPGP